MHRLAHRSNRQLPLLLAIALLGACVSDHGERAAPESLAQFGIDRLRGDDRSLDLLDEDLQLLGHADTAEVDGGLDITLEWDASTVRVLVAADGRVDTDDDPALEAVQVALALASELDGNADIGELSQCNGGGDQWHINHVHTWSWREDWAIDTCCNRTMPSKADDQGCCGRGSCTYVSLWSYDLEQDIWGYSVDCWQNVWDCER